MATEMRFRKEAPTGLPLEVNFAQVRPSWPTCANLQALTERVSRLEGVVQGLFAPRGDRTRHDDAA